MLNKKLTRRNALKLGLLSGGLALFSGQTNTPMIGTRRASAQTPFNGSPAVKNTAYVANEQTYTVSVIDTTTHTIKTTIGLGSDPAIAGTPQPNGPFNGETQHHNAFYNGHVDPHGLWLTPDASVLLVACRISGTVVAIDTVWCCLVGGWWRGHFLGSTTTGG
jgi:YVTN family beta-propeller protein